MKWRKNKKKQQSFSASSRPFLISQVLPTSWITKFKQMSLNSGEKNAKMKQRGKWNSVPTNSSRFSSDGGKFHGADGDAFWRLSFGEDSLEELKSRAVLRSVRYNSDDDLEFPPSSCQSCRSNATRANGKEYAHKFNDVISRVRKNSGFPKQVAILPQVQTCVREKVAEIRTPRFTVEKEKKLRKANQEMNLREDCKLTAADSRKECCTSPLNSIDSSTRKIEEEFEFTEIDGISEENFLSEWQKLKEKKVKEVKSRNEEQRKSMYISRELQRKKSKQKSKVRTYSPRTASRAEICKIKALEDMKKAKLKMKRKAKENATEDFQGLESFAVVKCSYDPQKDFRDSMIEMIEEKRISRPEELEELLACYLTLNSDEYHDLIIRVFRQVWLELSQACLDTELENEECH